MPSAFPDDKEGILVQRRCYSERAESESEASTLQTLTSNANYDNVSSCSVDAVIETGDIFEWAIIPAKKVVDTQRDLM